MPAPLEGRTALVTGASKGIGKGIALGLARAGCDLAINYHSDAPGAGAVAAEIGRLGRRALPIRADVGVAVEVDAMFAELFRQFGRLDILVNNAGTQVFKPLLELDEEEWDRVIATNLKGCFLCTQRAARHMKEHGGGRIINIGSGCNKAPFPGLVSYTASKGGIEMFTKVAAVELGPYHITVNCLAPGAIEIERTYREQGVDFAATWSRLTPAGRIGYPEDVAHAVVFLAGDGAGFITGQTIWIDGGLFTKPQWPYE
ncbi:MAG: SDR family NAD(P)-dependent oxidoreductase [Bryobacteraceae bacterium]|jgi:NAD(P)-dependent dehydrogenase (short-subunit alcohol dehydrogenase family)